MTGKMDIKTLKKSDIKDIVPLFLDVFSETPYDEHWNKKSAARRIGELLRQGSGFCFYAMDKGAIVAFLLCKEQQWDDGLHVFIEDAGVAKEYRKKGIARSLVKVLINAARKKKCVAIDLTAHEKAGAVVFWKKQGFIPTGYVCFRKNLR